MSWSRGRDVKNIRIPKMNKKQNIKINMKVYIINIYEFDKSGILWNKLGIN